MLDGLLETELHALLPYTHTHANPRTHGLVFKSLQASVFLMPLGSDSFLPKTFSALQNFNFLFLLASISVHFTIRPFSLLIDACQQ